jgi:hypothetical protein
VCVLWGMEVSVVHGDRRSPRVSDWLSGCGSGEGFFESENSRDRR